MQASQSPELLWQIIHSEMETEMLNYFCDEINFQVNLKET